MMPTLKLVFERQWLHALSLGLLLAGLVAIGESESVREGQLWGVGTPAWFWAAVLLAIAHQLLVWFCWRTELHASLLSRLFGRGGFTGYAVLFSVLGIARTAAVFLLAISNRESFDAPSGALKILALLLLVPAVYLFYSVRRYFGFRRAFGIDHFDASYRNLPSVKEGIFRFTDNGMYLFGFFLLWVPGLWFASAAALWVALFNHLYIWVHFYSTELPDMRRIYGTDAAVDVETSSPRPARRDDLPAMMRLLAEFDLPTQGVEHHLDRFVVVEAAGRLVGAGGLEIHGRFALLRSLAVAGNQRSRGIGGAICDRLESDAYGLGVEAIYLLTETAQAYFESRGYRTLPRTDAPPEIQASEEFRTLCPDSAVAMRRA